MIEITLLGTSALVPLPDRAQTAVLLKCAGHSILFDCGEGTQTAARKAQVSLSKIDLIALTHYHGDHIFGLPGLLQTLSALQGRTAPLYITGPKGLHEELAPILKLVGWISYEVRLMELPVEGLSLSTLFPGWSVEAKLTPFPTRHRVPSQGYTFTLERAGRFQPEKARSLGIPPRYWGALQKGQTVAVNERLFQPEQVLGEARKGLKFAMTGDTCLFPGLADAVRGADLLICDATYGENQQAQLALDHGHMNFAQAGQLASEAGAGCLWLAHYSQMIDQPTDFLPNAQAFFQNTVCGEDGMTALLEFDKR